MTGAAVRQAALNALTLSGAQVIELMNNASRAEALEMARLHRGFLDYASNLRGLAAMCEEAAMRFGVGLVNREDGMELINLADKQSPDGG